MKKSTPKNLIKPTTRTISATSSRFGDRKYGKTALSGATRGRHRPAVGLPPHRCPDGSPVCDTCADWPPQPTPLQLLKSVLAYFPPAPALKWLRQRRRPARIARSIGLPWRWVVNPSFESCSVVFPKSDSKPVAVLSKPVVRLWSA